MYSKQPAISITTSQFVSVQRVTIFISFVNSLPESVNTNCKCVLYADDTTLLLSSSDPTVLQNELNANLCHIADWFQSNKLTLNIKKTKLMLFGTRQALPNFKNISLIYGNETIEKVDKYKYLGVTFDSNLSWNDHVNYLSCNISKRIGVIRRVKQYLPCKTVKMLAQALVFPHFDYCSSVWANFSAYHFNELQILHNRLARVLLSADIRTPVVNMMEELDWDKLDCRWDYQLLILTFKCLHYIAPEYLSSNFTFVHSTHSKCTRSQTQNRLVVPIWKTSSGKRTFLYRGSVLWNKLPSEIRTNFDSMTLNEFKKAIAL
jgi:hypothetical protein